MIREPQFQHVTLAHDALELIGGLAVDYAGGVLDGYLYLRGGNLWLVIALHALFNTSRSATAATTTRPPPPGGANTATPSRGRHRPTGSPRRPPEADRRSGAIAPRPLTIEAERISS